MIEPLASEGGNAALDAILIAALVVPLPILGWVCWIFLRAKRREDAEKQKEAGWPSARSS
ncbi:MAG: hypothetical protein E6G67_12080 [Actinobacteria bacterium]|nr:MAG: hypothetical protein E6G67_12080 [Actinomycetota bacterium]